VLPRPEAVFLRVERDGQAMTLRLAQDPEGRERALVHVRGWAVSHVERVVPASLGEVLALALRELATDAGGGSPPVWKIAEPVAAALVRAGAQRGALARVSELRRTPAGVAWPRWPTGFRSGRPVRDGIWPFDPELEHLRRRTRAVIKREARSSEEAERDAEWLRGEGVRARVVGDITWAAHEEEAIDAALEDEERIAGKGTAADEAVRRMGARLGYPSCCVERFVSLGARDDATLASVLLPRFHETQHDPLVSWLVGGLALISHAPCSPACADTREIAASNLEALDAARPGFAERWRELATSVAAVDAEGRAWLLDVQRAQDRWRMFVIRAREVRPDLAAPVVDAADRVGRELRVTGGALEDAEGWRLPWASDHRLREVSGETELGRG
jgi:hypothetical protein